MNVNGSHYRTIWFDKNRHAVNIIDQTKLPHQFEIVSLTSAEQMAQAIKTMQVRGAPLIGAAAAYGFYLGLRNNPDNVSLKNIYSQLLATRPTAVNLRWALDRVQRLVENLPLLQRADAALTEANAIADEDVTINQAIGQHGFALIKAIWLQKQRPVNILTHCNAGWLATVDWGTALSGVYAAHNTGIPVHVWVDETRPRNQGAHLTTWELAAHGIPHTLIVDNVGGLLMQRDEVDICLVGTDRTTARGDVCNKVGTYLKALAAHDNQIPFYVAAPSPSIDWRITDMKNIPIEERDTDEVILVAGIDGDGKNTQVSIVPKTTNCKNYAFDITPSRYITGIISERGVCSASADGLSQLFPEHYPQFVT